MIHRCKTINQLYEEIKDFELVLTTDAALADALNRLVEKPRLGRLATTPMKNAMDNMEAVFDTAIQSTEKIILALSEDFRIRTVADAMVRIEHIWRHLGDREKIPLYLNDKEKEIFDRIKDLPTICLAMQNYREKREIAVIGEQLFLPLDRAQLPDNYRAIDIFIEGDFDLPEIYTFNSRKDIVDRIVEMLPPELSDDIAIIVPEDSEYSTLLKSRLKSIISTKYLSEKLETRTFLKFIEAKLYSENLSVYDIREIADYLGIVIDSTYNNYNLEDFIITEQASEFKEKYLMIIKSDKFSDIFEKFNFPCEIKNRISELGFIEKEVTQENLFRLRFMLDNFDKEISGSKKGILLADPKKSAFISRPIAFFIGLDNDWTRTAEDDNFIDKENIDKSNLDSFQILLQQGQKRYYFTALSSMSKQIIPSFYFNQLYGQKIESFAKPPFKSIHVANRRHLQPPSENRVPKITSLKEVKMLSNSRLNPLLFCPKSYELNDLASDEEQDYFEKGNILHEFAELYFEHREMKDNLADIIDTMTENLRHIIPKSNIPMLRTELKIACRNIMEFIDTLEIKDDGDKIRQEPGSLFSKYSKEKLNGNAEHKFEDEELGINGKIDLIVDSSKIIDYKTGKTVPSIPDIMSKARISKIKKYIDMQPLVYLSYMRKKNPGISITFTYYFPLGTIAQNIDNGSDIEQNKRYVVYYPSSINDFLKTKEGKILMSTNDDIRNLFGKVSEIHFNSFLDSQPIDDSILDSPEELENALRQSLKENGYTDNFDKAIIRIIKNIQNIMTGSYQKIAYFFKEDIDNFEKIVKKAIEDMNNYLKNGFPPESLKDELCSECDCNELCIWRRDI